MASRSQSFGIRATWAALATAYCWKLPSTVYPDRSGVGQRGCDACVSISLRHTLLSLLCITHLVGCPAERAAHARSVEPLDTGVIANLNIGDELATGDDNTGTLVATDKG